MKKVFFRNLTYGDGKWSYMFLTDSEIEGGIGDVVLNEFYRYYGGHTEGLGIGEYKVFDVSRYDDETIDKQISFLDKQIAHFTTEKRRYEKMLQIPYVETGSGEIFKIGVSKQ